MKISLLVLVVIGLVPLSCFANSGITIEKQIASFNAGNFAAAAQLGQHLVSVNPKDYKARYYYAAALMKLNRSVDAREQYAECYRTTNDPTMRTYCYQALQTLQNATSVPPATSATASTVDRSDSSVSSAEVSEPALAGRKLQVMNDGVKEIDFQRQQAQAKIQKARERAVEQMANIPAYFERPQSITSGGRMISEIIRIDNPDYKPAYEASQKDLTEAIEVINKDLARREAEITAACKSKAASYDQLPTAIRSQQKPGLSQIQMTPHNSSSYVRNFVNYDGSNPVSAKAKQGLLPRELGSSSSGKAAPKKP